VTPGAAARPKRRIIMNTLTRTEKHQTRPRTQKAFRGTELLVGGYLAISVLTLVGVVLLRNHRGVARAREPGLIP
jgi:hypothetical protein